MIYPDTDQTAEQVANHYNELDQYYRQLWGEHLHHGYFRYGNETVSQATENLIELVAKQARINEDSRVLDIGCGYGATDRFLAHKKGATVIGITLSKAQWQYARLKDPESTNPRYLLGDFLHNDLRPASFDAILSIESSEHMVDKPKFFQEVCRLLKPKGRFVTCAWLAKSSPTAWEVNHLLKPICNEGHLPSMGTQEDYEQMIAAADLHLLDFSDLSKAVKKTWTICIRRALHAWLHDKQLRHLLMDRRATEKMFAKTLFRIWLAYQRGAMRYGMFTVEKWTI